jgi:hypothetical protein
MESEIAAALKRKGPVKLSAKEAAFLKTRKNPFLGSLAEVRAAALAVDQKDKLLDETPPPVVPKAGSRKKGSRCRAAPKRKA